MNFNFSVKIISELLKWGVQEFYICAGLRNIPIIELLMQSNEKNVYSHFEERSAAFYAIGRIKALKMPVAVIVTSGTAAGELLPAIMEAYYSGLPLVVVTADRPRKQRGTGAPQAAEQKNLYGNYVSACIDIEAGENFSIEQYSKNMPLHMNPCFDIPLQSNRQINFLEYFNIKSVYNHLPSFVYNKNDVIEFSKFLNASKNLLVVVSKLEENEVKALIPFLIQLGAPIYLESISNIREVDELKTLKIMSPDKIWKNSEKSGFKIDAVLKIGGTPTHRIWRDLDEIKLDINIFSISNNKFPGSNRAKHITANLNQFFESHLNLVLGYQNKSCEILKIFLNEDLNSYQKINSLFNKYPESEQSFINYLSKIMNNNSRVYLGNSLSIRTWDFAAEYHDKNFLIEASRGLNGIDGQVSTFLGFAENGCENWAIFGDLTTLYDLAAPWALQFRPNLNINIVVMNNNGGMIFKGLLAGKSAQGCLNTHSINFKHWAKMWNLKYEQWCEFSHNVNINIESIQKRIIEIKPNVLQTENFNKEYLEI